MHPRRILPKLNIFSSRQPTASTAFSASSAGHSRQPSTPTPMSPPARLHLRNILPVSPEVLPTPPPPPRQPYPWRWKCHSCSMVYRLGCTRRCLNCSHAYCVSAKPLTTSRRGRKRRRTNGMCAAEFDYSGWAEWGAWRRKVLGLEVANQAGVNQRERAFVEKRHNCMEDCDFPSECHHERYRLAAEARRKSYTLDVLVEEPESPPIVASFPMSPDDDLPLNEALEVTEGEDEGEERKSPTSPKSPLRQTSFYWDQPESERNQEPRQDEKVWWADSAAQEQKRNTNSHQMVQNFTGTKPCGPYEAGSPAVDADALDEDALHSLMAEDERLMPTNDDDYYYALEAGQYRKVKPWNGTSASETPPPSTGRLTVRNLTDRDIWESESDSDSDPDSSESDSDSSKDSLTSFDLEEDEDDMDLEKD